MAEAKRGVVALAGGVGGAKLAYGLYQVAGEGLAVVVNTGDDFAHWGLHISPDLDTVMYNLAGINHPQQGWGLAGESFRAMDMVTAYGGETWFRLGDGDLGTHLMRTAALHDGQTLTAATRQLARGLGIQASLLPMSDSPVRTMVHTDEGLLAFQHYFVRRQCEPRLQSLEFAGLDRAQPTVEVLAALRGAAVIVLCPSNPYLSLDPILLLPGLAEALSNLRAPVVAVAPIVGGQALKGPAAKIMAELGVEVSAVEVARHLASRICLDGFVLDVADAGLADRVASLGITPLVTGTVMHTDEDKVRLAAEVLAFAQSLRIRGKLPPQAGTHGA